MATRRTFVKASLAVPFVAAASPAISAFQLSEVGETTELMLIDHELFPVDPLGGMVTSALRLGVPGDLYSFWQQTLRPRLGSGDICIAGITTGQSAFCLARVAEDYGYAITHSAPYGKTSGTSPLDITANELPGWQLNRPEPTLWRMSKISARYREA